jgi:threonine dehydratase
VNPEFYKDVDAALERIAAHIRRTPVEFSHSMSNSSGCKVLLKLENLQVTGSFKARGAVNKMSLLALEHPERIITFSSGNHGSAVAYAAKILEFESLIFLPETVSSAKLSKIEQFGAQVQIGGKDSGDTEQAARAYALKHGYPYVSPYNDYDVIAGQGTIAAEVSQQVSGIDAVFIAVGGGGLISGIGGYLKQMHPSVQIVACSPENSAAMHYSLEAGTIIDIDHLETISDGTAGALEENSITYEYCHSVVDQSVLLTEDEIIRSMKEFMNSHQMMIEGSAGVAIAGFSKLQHQFQNKQVLIVVCGANISSEKLIEVLS